ncbi:HI0074 family nucleotidyltransferase substrate-binding subunit [Hydrogenimonas sp.]
MALTKRLEDFANALERLEEAYKLAKKREGEKLYPFLRDSTIQRFEFTLEIGWKTIKSYLLEKEGVECRSPKGCIREFLSAGYLDPPKTQRLLEMVDDRNLATHTYHETVAEEIFGRIGGYIDLLKRLYDEMTTH